MYALHTTSIQTPRWAAARRAALPAAVRHWLLDERSLTRRLVLASGDCFGVRVLGQHWTRPLPDECRALGLRPGSQALVREVLLECAGEPWVYARSVLPAASLTGPIRHLRRFGSRSLGALLFSRRDTYRDPFEVARIRPGSGLWPALAGDAHALWARRSVFRVRGSPLLVCEVFLPSCRLGPL